MPSSTTSSGRPVGLAHQLLERVGRQRLQVGRHALVHAAARQLVERAPIERLDRDPQLVRARDERVDARPAPRSCISRETRRAFSASATALMP